MAPPSPTRRPSLAYLFAVTLSGILANTTLTPVIPDVLDHFGQPEGRAGLLVAAGPLPGVIIAPIIGVLADRLGRRRVLLPCLTLFGAAGLASALAPTFTTLLIARLLQGVGSAGLINLTVVIIGDHWEGNDRTRLIGRNAAVLTAGLTVVPSVAGLLAELGSWRWSLALTSLGIPLALLGARVLDDLRPAAPPSVGDQLRSARVAVRAPRVAATLVAGFFLFVVIFGVFLTTLPVHLRDEFDLGPGARGLVLSIPALGAVVASFNLARVRAILGQRITLTLSAALVAVAAFGVGVAPAICLIVVAGIVYGLGDGLGIPTLQDIAASSSNADQRGAVMSAWVASARLGQAVGPIAASAVFAATSTTAAMVLGAAMFAGVAVFFAIGPFGEQPVDAAENVQT